MAVDTELGRIVVSIAIFFFGHLIWTCLSRIIRKGKCKVVSKSETSCSVQTSLGAMKLDLPNKELIYSMQGMKGSVKFSDIKGFIYDEHQDGTFLIELFTGYDLTDSLNRYSDRIKWYSICIETVNGDNIPFYLVGQYEPREFLFTWLYEIEEYLLTKIGLFRSAKEKAMNSLKTIESIFKSNKISTTLSRRTT